MAGRAIKFTTNPPFESIITSIDEPINGQSGGISAQNQPNPFNTSSTIYYSVPESGIVNVNIYDITGKLMKTLVNEQKSGGKHAVVWDGNDNKGIEVSPGMYFYRIQSGNHSCSGKMVRLK
jgi:flagellar hook assembly protein FlgD